MSATAVERIRKAAKRAIDDHTQSGGANTGHGAIASALQRVEDGLSQRRIGVALVKIPSLRDEAPSAKTAASVRTLLEDISTIASNNRGEVQCVAGCTVLITVNAGAPAAQPAVRAALIALEVTRFVQEEGLIATAGTAFGEALVGHYNNSTAGAADGGSSSFAALGPLLRQAKLAQRMAERSGLSVCSLDTNNYARGHSRRLQRGARRVRQAGGGSSCRGHRRARPDERRVAVRRRGGLRWRGSQRARVAALRAAR